MKKGRPAAMCTVLCQQSDIEKYSVIVLEQSTSIGIRVVPVTRFAMKREVRVVPLPSLGPKISITAKISRLNDRIVTVKPEFDDCKELADRLGFPLKVIMNQVSFAMAGISD